MKSLQQVTGGDGSNRAVSEVLAIVLLVGIVFLIIGAILLVGGSQIAQDREANEIAQVEQALTEFDSEAARSAFGGNNVREIDLGVRTNRGVMDVEEEAGQVSVKIGDYNNQEQDPYVIFEDSLGAVRYESGDSSVAYQGGGVWRADGNGNSTMVSPPQIEFQDDTLTLNFIRSQKSGSIHSQIQLEDDGQVRHFPDHDPDPEPEFEHKLDNVLDPSNIFIQIQSEYYLAWGNFFIEEIDGLAEDDVRYDHAENKVFIDLIGGLDAWEGVEGGIITTSGTGDMILRGTGGEMYVDSYNSGDDIYDNHSTEDRKKGLIKSAGMVELRGNSEILGEVRSNTEVILHQNSMISGDVIAGHEIDAGTGGGDSCEEDECTIMGDASAPSVENQQRIAGDTDEDIDGYSIPTLNPINDTINETYDQLKDDNDNENAEIITDSNEIALQDNTGTLEAGKYYLDNLDLDPEDTLELDTGDGDIKLVVRDYINLQQANQEASQIEVVGDGNVEIYIPSLKSEETLEGDELDKVNLYIEGSSQISVPDDKSPKFLIYGQENFNATIGYQGGGDNPAEITAGIIAPAGEDGIGTVEIDHVRLYGTIITGTLISDPGQPTYIHFDRALIDEEIIPQELDTVSIDYLYVIESAIRIGSN